MNANSPPGAEQERGLDRSTGQGMRNRRRRPTSTPPLIDDQPDDAGDDGQRVGDEKRHVEAHADREEEHAEQQPLERIDGRLDGAVVLGLGQQQPRDEGAERHRQAGRRAGEPAADGDEQRCGDEQLGAVGGGDEAEQRTQDDRADERDRGDDEYGLREGLQQPAQQRALVVGPEDGDEKQQRHDGEVLQKQDREARAARRGVEALFARQAPR